MKRNEKKNWEWTEWNSVSEGCCCQRKRIENWIENRIGEMREWVHTVDVCEVTAWDTIAASSWHNQLNICCCFLLIQISFLAALVVSASVPRWKEAKRFIWCFAQTKRHDYRLSCARERCVHARKKRYSLQFFKFYCMKMLMQNTVTSMHLIAIRKRRMRHAHTQEIQHSTDSYIRTWITQFICLNKYQQLILSHWHNLSIRFTVNPSTYGFSSVTCAFNQIFHTMNV